LAIRESLIDVESLVNHALRRVGVHVYTDSAGVNAARVMGFAGAIAGGRICGLCVLVLFRHTAVIEGYREKKQTGKK
jgi:hypothetical protein